MSNQFACLNDFVGYGPNVGYDSKKLRFVFIGIEEHGDGSELDLQTRCGYSAEPLFDKNMACENLARAFRSRGNVRSASKIESALTPRKSNVWTFCAKIVAEMRGTGWESEYDALGTSNGDTLVTSLFPIPKPRYTSWPKDYIKWFGYESYSKYYETAWPLGKESLPSARKKLLQEVVLERLPPKSVVVCYGKGFWDHFSDLLGLSKNSWAPVVKGRIENAETANGIHAIRTGFPLKRHYAKLKGRVAHEHIPLIVEALRQGNRSVPRIDEIVIELAE